MSVWMNLNIVTATDEEVIAQAEQHEDSAAFHTNRAEQLRRYVRQRQADEQRRTLGYVIPRVTVVKTEVVCRPHYVDRRNVLR